MDKQQNRRVVPKTTSSPQESHPQQTEFIKKYLFWWRYNNVGKKWRASIFSVALLLVGLFSLVYITQALADLIFFPPPVEGFQTRVILKPSLSPDVDAAELLETRKVVAQRLDQFNAAGSYQLVAQHGQLSLTLPATEQTPYIVDLVSRVGQIEFIDGGATSPPLGRWIRQNEHNVLFTAHDVEAVTPPNAETGQIFYRLKLTSASSQQMAEFVANQSDHYICIVIDQQVINCSSMYHLTDDTLDILPSLGSGNTINLNDLAVFVKSGPLPISLSVER